MPSQRREAGFNGLATHRAEHHRLSAELAELAEHTHRVGAALTIRFLRDWLIGHMQGYDRMAARAICAARAKCGVPPPRCRLTAIDGMPRNAPSTAAPTVPE